MGSVGFRAQDANATQMKQAWLILIAVISCQAGVEDSATRLWATLLQGNISIRNDGRSVVSYSQLAGRQEALAEAAREFALVPKDSFETWTPERRKAFLINAYNLTVWRVIATYWPIPSILATPLGEGIWIQPTADLLGTRMSLNEMENILRSHGDARIHFALNCGALSCPPLRAEAYLGVSLETQLNQQSMRFIRTDCPGGGKPSDSCSSIFRWYAKDFIADRKFNRLLEDSGFATPARALVRSPSRSYFWDLIDSTGER